MIASELLDDRRQYLTSIMELQKMDYGRYPGNCALLFLVIASLHGGGEVNGYCLYCLLNMNTDLFQKWAADCFIFYFLFSHIFCICIIFLCMCWLNLYPADCCLLIYIININISYKPKVKNGVHALYSELI